jgi:hypothetical protein
VEALAAVGVVGFEAVGVVAVEYFEYSQLFAPLQSDELYSLIP